MLTASVHVSVLTIVTPSALFVYTHLRACTVGSPDLVVTTLKSFLSHAPKTLKSMRTAYESSNFIKLRRDAHSLKGACSYVASDCLKASSLRLQLAAEAAERGEESDPSVEVCVQRVMSDLSLVCAAIEKELGDASLPPRAPVKAPMDTPRPEPAVAPVGASASSAPTEAVLEGTPAVAAAAPAMPSSSSAAAQAGTASSDQPQMIDISKIRDNLGDEALVTSTLKSFLSHAPKTLKSMRTAYESSNFIKLRRDAHSLKGACSYVASDCLKASSLRLQLAAEAAERGEESDPSVEVCVQRVMSDLSLVCAAIEKELAALSIS